MKKAKNPLNISSLELYRRIDEINDRLKNDKEVNDILKDEKDENEKTRKVQTRKSKQDKRYATIYKILDREFNGASPISKTNIWRYLWVKENSPSLYKEIIAGQRSIRNAYDTMVAGKEIKTKKKEKAKKDFEYNFASEPNYNKIDEMLDKLNKQLENINVNQVACPQSKIKNIDENLYKLRKKFGEITAKRIINDIDET